MSEDIWEILRERLDYGRFVPRPIADLERASLRHRDGRPYTMIKNPHGDGGAGTYLRLEPEDVALLDLMDGERTISDIVIARLEQSGTFALDRLARVTAALAANGFFGEERPRFYQKLQTRRALRDPLVRLSLLLRRFIVWDMARWSNADVAVRRLYRWGGRLAFTAPGAVLIGLICVAGIAAWVSEVRAGRHALVTVDGSFVLGIVALIALQVLSISVHEAGHALAIVHYGRRVRRLGLAIYYVFPCVYVDATDMAMTSRAARVVVALAGPVGGLLVGALCAFVAATDGGTIGGLAFKAASLFIFQFALNLMPILELDGYHILVDLLDAPMLRGRSIAFARGGIVRKLRRRERWTPQEVGLGLYGVLAIGTSLVMLAFSLALWQSRVAVAARELLALGPGGLLVLALLVVVFIGPLLIALALRLVGWGRALAAASAARARRVHAEALAERARALSRVPFLVGLNGPSLMAIASHLREVDVASGATVVTIGEPGDSFYLVRDGELEAVDANGRVLTVMGAGDGFGELALLDRRPRGATVRATEPAHLWALDRGHFERWIRDRYEIAARIRASSEEREALRALPFFRGLEPNELDRVAKRLETVRVRAGEAVVREGDRGDRYYVVRQGEAEVSAGGRVLGRLGPGAGFGEIALLFGSARTATVTAVTDLVLATLRRPDFAWLVQASGETMGEFRARTAHYVGAAGLGTAVGGA
ncbi:MAG TPA: cyclic nucleotide-binding domain-containing protein [Candidatus Acidoferrales bacterium]|nr:cyclic nucleotide-binding domain-containing protein [Candidatus Acidoferrales bacterium]